MADPRHESAPLLRRIASRISNSVKGAVVRNIYRSWDRDRSLFSPEERFFGDSDSSNDSELEELMQTKSFEYVPRFPLRDRDRHPVQEDELLGRPFRTEDNRRILQVREGVTRGPADINSAVNPQLGYIGTAICNRNGVENLETLQIEHFRGRNDENCSFKNQTIHDAPRVYKFGNHSTGHSKQSVNRYAIFSDEEEDLAGNAEVHRGILDHDEGGQKGVSVNRHRRSRRISSGKANRSKSVVKLDSRTSFDPFNVHRNASNRTGGEVRTRSRSLSTSFVDISIQKGLYRMKHNDNIGNRDLFCEQVPYVLSSGEDKAHRDASHRKSRKRWDFLVAKSNGRKTPATWARSKSNLSNSRSQFATIDNAGHHYVNQPLRDASGEEQNISDFCHGSDNKTEENEESRFRTTGWLQSLISMKKSFSRTNNKQAREKYNIGTFGNPKLSKGIVERAQRELDHSSQAVQHQRRCKSSLENIEMGIYKATVKKGIQDAMEVLKPMPQNRMRLSLDSQSTFSTAFLDPGERSVRTPTSSFFESDSFRNVREGRGVNRSRTTWRFL